ncbi:MAG: NADH-quinone oxidoreductase subunit C [Planctomycetota bacterium]|jgi:Ni,Fe-hydrogenase III component G
MNQEELNNRLSEIKEKLLAFEQPLNDRIIISCEPEDAYAINQFLLEDICARFVVITGIDADDCFELLYHYSYDQTGCVITIKTFIRDRQQPQIESITPLLPAAEWIEREIHDVLGIKFKNHPNLKRLILADDWPEGVYPLRKEAKNEKDN